MSCRLNLAEGRFLAPLPARSPGINACGISPSHGLVACAGEDGVLECFDLRQRSAAGFLDAAAAMGQVGQAVHCLNLECRDPGAALSCGGA